MTTNKLGLPEVAGSMAADVPLVVNNLAQAIDAKAGVAGGLALHDDLANAGTVNEEDLALKADVTALDLKADKTELATKAEQADLDIATAQLADTSLLNQQTDFVELVKSRVDFNQGHLKKLSAIQSEVVMDDSTNHITYRFAKDPTDDYIKMSKTYVGKIGDYVISKSDVTLQTITGTWNQTSLAGSNWFTVDKTATLLQQKVTGERIEFVSYKDNRGGRWQFVIDKGLPGEKTVIISTFSAVPVSTFSHELASGLANIEHTVEGVFLGDDPNNPPSSGAETSRGWLYASPTNPYVGTFNGTLKINNPESKRLLIDGSNKEGAFSVTYNGVTAWLPEHYEVGTVFNTQDTAYQIDGKTIDFKNAALGKTWIYKSSVKIIQRCVARISATDIANFTLTYTATLDGAMKWDGKITALKSFSIAAGYPLMIPLANETFSGVTTGLYNSKTSDLSGAIHFFTEEGDAVFSSVGVDSANPDYIVAGKVDNHMKSMRLKETDGKPPVGKSLYLSQRADFPKVYYASFEGKQMAVGESYTWGGQIIGAEIKDAYSLVK